MKTLCAGAALAVLILAVSAILAACAPPLDNRAQGNLRIVLAGGAPAGARTAIDPATEAGLSYQLEFSSPGGETLRRALEPGASPLILSLTLGNWTIRAEAFLGGVFYGSGETVVLVEAGRTAEAEIHMKVAAAEILSFSFVDPPAAGIINAADKTIAVTVLPGTDLTGLIPEIAVSPHADFSPRGAQDFSGPVVYTVTAANGATAAWTVTVTALVPFATIAEVAAYLASAPGGSAASPVPLPVMLNLADPGGNGWADLLGAIAAADKHVALDLSVCAVDGMTPTSGEFDPGHTISAGKNRIVSLVLPDTATGIPASASNATAFASFDVLERITGRDIVSIGDFVFNGCAALVSVDFPAVKTIGNSAFYDCASLSSISLPAGLTFIGEQAFSGCGNLTTITVDSGNAGYSAQGGMLLNNTGDTLIAYPSAAGTVTLSGITTVGGYAFSGCAALTSAELPNVGYIDSYAFSHTGTGPLTVTLDSPNPVWLGLDIFSNVLGAKTVIVRVPSTATAYGSSPTGAATANWGNGFRGGGWSSGAMTNSSYINSNITVIIMPEYLVSVPDVAAYLAAVSGGASASNPVSLPVSLNLANDWGGLLGAIGDNNKYVALDLSTSGIAGMTGTFGEFDPDYTSSTGKNRIVSLVLPDMAESIARGTPDYPLDSWLPSFRYFTALASITGRNLTGVDGIGHYAFAGCASLTSVDFPAVAVIGDSAFSGCTALTTADFPALTEIGGYAFAGCTGLTSVTLPASLATVYSNPFAGCANLMNIIVESGNPGYRADNGMLFDITTVNDTLISYPASAGDIILSGITLVGEYAFKGNTALTSVTLPAVTVIGDSAFRDCANLRAVNSSVVTDIGYSAFEGCTGLETAIFLAATTVMDGAFSGCSSLTAARVPLATSVSARTFEGCASLTEVDVSSVTDVLGSAFYGCASLETLNLPLVAFIDDYAFAGCTALTTVCLGTLVPPNLGISIFANIDTTQGITLEVPAAVSAWSSIISGSGYFEYAIPFTDNWGNGFRGGGWSSGAMINTGTSNPKILLYVYSY